VWGICAAFVSKFGAILQTIPQAVMGGVSLILFGMITSVGVRTMVNAEVDFSKPRNLMITALMLTVGIGGAVLKVGRVELKGIGLAALVGIFLNLILPDRD